MVSQSTALIAQPSLSGKLPNFSLFEGVRGQVKVWMFRWIEDRLRVVRGGKKINRLTITGYIYICDCSTRSLHCSLDAQKTVSDKCIVSFFISNLGVVQTIVQFFLWKGSIVALLHCHWRCYRRQSVVLCMGSGRSTSCRMALCFDS